MEESQVVVGRDMALVARGLEKTYRGPAGAVRVLSGACLEVERGTILAILGVSGSGKSTLLNLLGTLDRPDRGEVIVGGRRVDDLGEAERARFRARRIGFVFQFHHLLPEFSAEENVMMPLLIAGAGPVAARRQARAALVAVGMTERWEHRPAELSGGESQRVAVARAIAPEPELMLADEPSGNLDPAAAEALHGMLESLARERGRTLVIVTHNDRLAALADRTLRLSSGRLVGAR